MGKIIAVYGAGGSGKTTVAANLGYVLSQKHVVGIIATNTNYGCIQHLLGVTVDDKHGLYELAVKKNDFSQIFTTCPNNKNLFLLTLSNTQDCLKLADEESSMNVQTAKNVLTEMREMFHYLIIDCDTDVNNPMSVYSLIYANNIINLIKPTVPGMAFFHAYTPLFAALDIHHDKILHVANNDKNYVGVRNIEKVATIKVALTIPFCRAVEEAENHGVPVCKSGHNEFTTGIDRITEIVKDGGSLE